MRALFTAGILDVLLENGVRFDGMIGVSAGATFGCNFKSRQVGRALRYNMRFIHDPRYMGWRSWVSTGDWVSAEFSYHTLPDQLDRFDWEAWSCNPMAFQLVCTDVDSGKAVYKHVVEPGRESLEWLRASASMPVAARPVCIGGRRLLDGGISDSIPLQYFQSLGYRRCVVILTQPIGFRKKRTRLMPLLRMAIPRYPAILEAMNVRHEMYNRELDYLAREQAAGRALVICPPSTIAIGRLEQNARKMQHVYDQGRKAGEAHLEAIRAFLGESPTTNSNIK